MGFYNLAKVVKYDSQTFWQFGRRQANDATGDIFQFCTHRVDNTVTGAPGTRVDSQDQAHAGFPSGLTIMGEYYA